MNTYADPLLVPSSSSEYAPITIVSPSIDTLVPNRSPPVPSPAVSLVTCVQPEARSLGVLRLNTYADPLWDRSRPAPITTVSPSIDTLMPKLSP